MEVTLLDMQNPDPIPLSQFLFYCLEGRRLKCGSHAVLVWSELVTDKQQTEQLSTQTTHCPTGAARVQLSAHGAHC